MANDEQRIERRCRQGVRWLLAQVRAGATQATTQAKQVERALSEQVDGLGARRAAARASLRERFYRLSSGADELMDRIENRLRS